MTLRAIIPRMNTTTVLPVVCDCADCALIRKLQAASKVSA